MFLLDFSVSTLLSKPAVKGAALIDYYVVRLFLAHSRERFLSASRSQACTSWYFDIVAHGDGWRSLIFNHRQTSVRIIFIYESRCDSVAWYASISHVRFEQSMLWGRICVKNTSPTIIYEVNTKGSCCIFYLFGLLGPIFFLDCCKL